MRARRAFSLVEIAVAVGIGVLVLAAMYATLGFLGRSEQAADRRATRVITTARLLEYLMNDARSAAKSPEKLAGSGYRIERYIREKGPLVTRVVTYRNMSKDTIVREIGGSVQQQFRFEGALEPDLTSVKWRLEGEPDVEFVP